MQSLVMLKKEFPSMGGTMLWGQLRAMGFVVTRSRVRWAHTHSIEIERTANEATTIFCTQAKHMHNTIIRTLGVYQSCILCPPHLFL